jgi:hypothetical protein
LVSNQASVHIFHKRTPWQHRQDSGARRLNSNLLYKCRLQIRVHGELLIAKGFHFLHLLGPLLISRMILASPGFQVGGGKEYLLVGI